MRLPRHVKGRLGYTTGACAAAALKAALLALRGESPRSVSLTLPVGLEARFPLHHLSRNGNRAVASVIKDAGDDPDVTHRAEIRVEVSLRPGEGRLSFRAGEGVGVVTKPGLGIPVGEPAITKVPRLMMAQVVEEVLGPEAQALDVEVTVSIPGGEELAKNTLNARLGIQGGLSILGTKGIVIPYSTAAYKATIAKSFLVARALGLKELVLTTGGRTEAFAQRLWPELSEEAFVQIGDYVKFSLRTARALGFERLTLAMMIGKLSKVAVGFPQTHAKHGEVPLDFLTETLKACGAPAEVLEEARKARTARGVLEIVLKRAPEILAPWAGSLCRRAALAALELAGGGVTVKTVLFDFEGKVLAQAEEKGR